MIARRDDVDLLLPPGPHRFLWLWGVLAGIAIAVGLMTIRTCRDDRDEDRPKMTPIVPGGEGPRR